MSQVSPLLRFGLVFGKAASGPLLGLSKPVAFPVGLDDVVYRSTDIGHLVRHQAAFWADAV